MSYLYNANSNAPASEPTSDDTSPGGNAPTVEVPLGDTMAPVDQIPVRLPQTQAVQTGAGAERISTLAEGLSFTGSATLDGSITVSGEFQGDIRVLDHSDGHVTITETGMVVGDVRSRQIAVLGQTAGTLDAAGGKVLLHASSSVSGRIRYTHLQVNGADLNAQLERVRSDGEAGSGH